ncbi:MAG: glycosyltransferase family 9 protein [Pseudomonadota bacterium]
MKSNLACMPQPVLSGVQRIVVLRPNAVGDFVFCLPALHALRAAYPDAEIIYIGKQWHANFLKGRPGPIDDVAVIPPCAGVGAPVGSKVDNEKLQLFVDSMRAREFDLAVQIYGGGGYSNPFIKRLEARLCIGMKTIEAEPLDRWVAFHHLQNMRLKMVEVTGLVGANALRLEPELEVTARDRLEAAHIISVVPSKPFVVIHPSATDTRRHWPVERFAAIADVFAEAGALIAINGNGLEAAIVRQVIDKMRHPAINLAGNLSLSGLCGLLERASLLISNDSGPLHLALAIGTPCVGIYWLTNLYDSGPLMQRNHRAALSVRVHCPVCGAENLRRRCAHDVSFVEDVSTDEVMGLAFDLYHAQ